jgi:hypothetical protein
MPPKPSTHSCAMIINQKNIKIIFVFLKAVSGKSLSKLSYVCLPLEKLVNEKHFSVKGKSGLVFRKMFS